MMKRTLLGGTALSTALASPTLASGHGAIEDGMNWWQHVAYHAEMTLVAIQMGDAGLAWSAFNAQAICTTGPSWLLFSPAGLMTLAMLASAAALANHMVKPHRQVATRALGRTINLAGRHIRNVVRTHPCRRFA